VLDPLDAGQPVGRFDRFTTERAARTRRRAGGGEVYRVRVETRGPWAGAAPYAVYAIWHVAAPARAGAFEQRRRERFRLRGRVLPTFAVDWHRRAAAAPGRSLVLGLYGDEAGLRRCRDHPDIRRFAQHHRPPDYAAPHLSGLRFFRVPASDGPAA
jgi:hypothetical protein